MEFNKKSESGVIEIPLYQNLILFVTGWLGLSVFSTIISVIITSIIDTSSATTSLVTTLNVIVNVGSYSLLLVSLLFILGKDLIKRIFSDFTKIKKVLYGLLFGIIVILAQVLVNTLIQTLAPNTPSNENQSAIVVMVHSQPLLMFIAVVILAPICEEITYRLGLFGALYKKNRILAHIVSALFFGLLHSIFLSSKVFTATSEQMITELLNLPSYIISGLIFSIAYEKEQSLTTSITAHMTNNLLSYISVLLIQSQFIILR